MKKPIVLLIFLFLIILGLALVQIGLSNKIATTGEQLTALQNEIDVYKKENTILNQKLLSASSLTTIAAKAKKLGFVDDNTQIDLSAPLPLALRQ